MRGKIFNLFLAMVTGGLLLAGAAVAQTTTTTQADPTANAGPGAIDPEHPRVNEVNAREANQQQRIANGIKSGQLTPAEASRLERHEQTIENHEKRDMARNGGHLTKQEQERINKHLNQESKHIYRDKHNQ